MVLFGSFCHKQADWKIIWSYPGEPRRLPVGVGRAGNLSGAQGSHWMCGTVNRSSTRRHPFWSESVQGFESTPG